jgi:DNA transformation protein
MSWSDPDPALVELFDATVVADRRVERRTLFGCPAAFVGGHLAGTVFRDQFVLKLGEADAARLHAGRVPQQFEPLPGRRMRELFVVPRGVVTDRKVLRDWIRCALERVAAWPPKTGTPRARGRRPAAGEAPAPRADAFERLGPRSREWLAGAGIDSIERLRTTGSVRAYAAVRRSGARPSLNLLWALEGALTGERWQDVAREHRTSLLLALEDELASAPSAAR